MADTERKFSELVNAGVLTGAEIMAMSQTNVGTLLSVKVTLQAIANWFAVNSQYASALDTSNKTLCGAINELKQLISLIPQFSIEVVQTLPTEDISETTIYLVPNSAPEQGNYYEEYIYVNNTWELVGTTAVDLSAYYTKLDVDGLLAAKANTSDVTSALALKEAKADMNDDVTDIIVALTDTQTTAAGNPVTFTTKQAGGAKSALVTFTPKQSGTGDPSPSNIRPISGWDSLSLTRAGVNQWDEEWELGYYNLSTGQKVNSTTTIRTKNYIRVAPSTGYYFLCKSLELDCFRIIWYDANKNFVSSNSMNTDTNRVINSPNNAYFCTFYCGTKYGTTYNHDISINYPATDTEYHAYEVETYTATFPNTVYGGKMDFVSGKLTITQIVETFTSVQTGGASSTDSWWARVSSNAKPMPNNNTIANIRANFLHSDTANRIISQEDNIIGVNTNGYINIKIKGMTSLSDYDTYLMANPLQVCYELATPTEITLTPADVNLLKGSNTVWTDGDTVQVKYSELPNGNLGAVIDYIKKLEARVKALES